MSEIVIPSPTYSPVPGLSAADREDLRRARWALEYPSFAARLSSLIGVPLEAGFRRMPASWQRRLQRLTEAAVRRALDTALVTLEAQGRRRFGARAHGVLAAGSGAVGGFFGLPGLALELPVTTTLMLRAIAEEACVHGEDLSLLQARSACLEVFALGARSEADDAAETGYYGVRLGLAVSVSEALGHVARHGIAAEGAPLLVRGVSAIASRFGLACSDKAAAQLLPVVGAAGAGLVNAVFMQHFMDTAWAHFTVRRLERCYGAERIRAEYERLGRCGAV